MERKVFVNRLIDVATHYKTVYVMGCFGSPMNADNKKRYTSNHAYNTSKDRTNRINSCSPDTFGFDCVCLIKGILWGWNGDTTKTYGGSVYTSNGVPDIGADQLIKKCLNVSTDFSGIVQGALVHMAGHVGVYIGDGLVVECSPKWKDGVQVTAVSNLGGVSGYNSRTWERWGTLPYIDYGTDDEAPDLSGRTENTEGPDEWASEAWAAAVNAGITDGTRPRDTITRQEVVTLLHRLNLF